MVGLFVLSDFTDGLETGHLGKVLRHEKRGRLLPDGLSGSAVLHCEAPRKHGSCRVHTSFLCVQWYFSVHSFLLFFCFFPRLYGVYVGNVVTRAHSRSTVKTMKARTPASLDRLHHVASDDAIDGSSWRVLGIFALSRDVYSFPLDIGDGGHDGEERSDAARKSDGWWAAFGWRRRRETEKNGGGCS